MRPRGCVLATQPQSHAAARSVAQYRAYISESVFQLSPGCQGQYVFVDTNLNMTSPVSEVHEPLADGHIRLLELNLEHENDIVGRL